MRVGEMSTVILRSQEKGRIQRCCMPLYLRWAFCGKHRVDRECRSLEFQGRRCYNLIRRPQGRNSLKNGSDALRVLYL